MDWKISTRVPYLDLPFRVWLADNSVRAVRYVRTMMGLTLHFTDCTHPMQNVICDAEKVWGWMLATPPGDG